MVQDDFEKDQQYIQPVESVPQDDAKAELIKTINQKDQAAFLEWIRDPQNKLKLSMPKEALRYLVIPPQLLELAERPEYIDLSIVQQEDNKLAALILERGAQGISSKFPFNRDELVKQGLMQNTDEVMAAMQMGIENSDQLYIDDIEVVPNRQKQGIATSFYYKLHSLADQLGIPFIKGYNSPKNIDFFVRKLGRTTLDNIRPHLRDQYFPESKGVVHNLYSVDFVRDQDRVDFIQPPAIISK